MNAHTAGDWRAALTQDGSWTLLHPAHGEGCHSDAGAWTQARERYAAVIADLPEATKARGCVRLLDIGTGLGLNLAAALEACEARGLKLDATSLELDPTVLVAAFALFRREPTCSDGHRRILDALEARWEAQGPPPHAPATAALESRGHRLNWILGDARRTLLELSEDRRFDVVFLDPFSPRVDPPLWDADFLAEVARRMDPGARLSTYTVALRVRVALARAGLSVGQGPPVGRKAAGTLASRGGELPPLDERAGQRLARALE